MVPRHGDWTPQQIEQAMRIANSPAMQRFVDGAPGLVEAAGVLQQGMAQLQAQIVRAWPAVGRFQAVHEQLMRVAPTLAPVIAHLAAGETGSAHGPPALGNDVVIAFDSLARHAEARRASTGSVVEQHAASLTTLVRSIGPAGIEIHELAGLVSDPTEAFGDETGLWGPTSNAALNESLQEVAQSLLEPAARGAGVRTQAEARRLVCTSAVVLWISIYMVVAVAGPPLMLALALVGATGFNATDAGNLAGRAWDAFDDPWASVTTAESD